MSEKEEKFSKDGLKKSVELVGKLLPVIEDERTGEILEGQHRLEVDPNWERKIIQTRNDIQAILIKIHSHYRRTRDKEETRGLLLDLAQEMEKTGFYEKEKICARVAELVPYTTAYVNQLLPDEYKDLKHASPTYTSIGSKTPEQPPKIRPEPEEQKPEDLRKKLFEKCPFCGVSFDYLKSFTLEERLKLQNQHIDSHTTKPEEKKKKPLQKDISITHEEPSAQEILEYFDKDDLVRATILSVWKCSKCAKGNCSECEISNDCHKAMSYLPIKPA